MPQFTPQIVHDVDPALYYAGMLHVYAYTKGEKNLKTPDSERELECHRGAAFFFAVSSFIRVFGRIPKGKEESEAVDQFLIDLGVRSRWRPSGRASSQDEAGQGSSDPSAS
jgi:hypothetical protein